MIENKYGPSSQVIYLPLWPEFWNLDKTYLCLKCSVTFTIVLRLDASDENGREKKQKLYINAFFLNWYFEKKGRWKCFLLSSHTLSLSQRAASVQLRQRRTRQAGATFPGCREGTQLTDQRGAPGPIQTACDPQHQGAAFKDIKYLWRVACTFSGL